VPGVRQTAVVGLSEGFTTEGGVHTVVDTGWLLVGVAGVAGGLALVLVGAGIAAAPLLLPVGALLAVIAYLAWVAGSARVVATVYETVGDPGRDAPADDRTGRPEDRADPDGNWRSTAADGGHSTTRSAEDIGPPPGPGSGSGATAERAAGSDGPSSTSDAGTTQGSADGSRAGVGPDEEPIWDAEERDRVGGWDDWEWEWADEHWRSFQESYGSASADERPGDADAGTGAGTGTGSQTGARSRAGSRAGSGAANGGRRAGGGRSSRAGDDRQRDTDARQQARGGSNHDGRRRRRGRGGRAGRSRSRAERRRHGRQAKRARELLEVSADADDETVRDAYRERVKEVHPDRGGDPERFKQVKWAYEYLTDE
jgi:hypothetical protein